MQSKTWLHDLTSCIYFSRYTSFSQLVICSACHQVRTFPTFPFELLINTFSRQLARIPCFTDGSTTISGKSSMKSYAASRTTICRHRLHWDLKPWMQAAQQRRKGHWMRCLRSISKVNCLSLSSHCKCLSKYLLYPSWTSNWNWTLCRLILFADRKFSVAKYVLDNFVKSSFFMEINCESWWQTVD